MRFPRLSALPFALTPLLIAGLAGCRHKVPPPAPQVSTAPPLPPSSITHVPPVPGMPAPAPPQVGPPGSDQKPQQAATPPPQKPRRPKKHALPATSDTTTASSATAANSTTPLPSLGQLSAGAGADSHERAAMSEQIHAQELRLEKIKHPLDDEGEAITKQVRVFLSKAREAVSENDLDGAQTLTTKAKVLLDELIPS